MNEKLDSKIWLGLLPADDHKENDRLVGAAIEAGKPIDISSAQVLWGGKMRGTDACLISFSGTDIKNAIGVDHAVNLILADLIQTLSSIGREYLDLFILSVSEEMSDHQKEGAVTALNSAKSEGSIRKCGVFVNCSATEISEEFLKDDVFDVLMAANNPLQTQAWNQVAHLAGTEKQLVSNRTLNWCEDGECYPDLVREDLVQSVIRNASEKGNVLVGVRSEFEIKKAVTSEQLSMDDKMIDRIEHIASEAIRSHQLA